MNASTSTGQSNGKVLTVDGSGLLFLAPDQGGSQWSTSGSNVHFNGGNVGIGTTNPLQRLHVNGDINIPSGSAIRINNLPFLSAPGTANVLFGMGAGGSLTSGGYNVFLGSFTGQQNTTGNYNVFLGPYAGQNTTTGSNNYFAGVNAGKANTTGQSNSFIGTGAGAANTTGSLNTFIGANAGRANTTASLNFFAGVNAGYNNTTGVRNLLLGYNSGFSNQIGNDNIFIGGNAGDGIISGNSNIFIGLNAKPSGPNLTTISNAVAIGTNATVETSNSIVLGGTEIPQINVGIGNTKPATKLHVTAGGTVETGVRFENLPNSTGTVFNLYVDANGNVMKSTSSGARESVLSDINWTISRDENLINNNIGGVLIGTGIKNIPDGYKLYVSEGILTEKVKVALKNTNEWSDYVFEKNYNLLNLEEVEYFIKKKKHLPGVPSAEEMLKTGNDLHKTDALLLQKIEELTLYLIDLKKQNQELEQKIKKIENR
ncbi:hypothetical protein GCM10027291_32040 [Telluribacter humicola]